MSDSIEDTNAILGQVAERLIKRRLAAESVDAIGRIRGVSLDMIREHCCEHCRREAVPKAWEDKSFAITCSRCKLTFAITDMNNVSPGEPEEV